MSLVKSRSSYCTLFCQGFFIKIIHLMISYTWFFFALCSKSRQWQEPINYGLPSNENFTKPHHRPYSFASAGPGNTIRVTCDIILICWPHRPYSLSTSSLKSRLKFFWFLFFVFFTDGFAYKIRNKFFLLFSLLCYRRTKK